MGSSHASGYGSSTSLFKGVSWEQSSGKWKVQIRISGKRTHLGSYADEERAARRYDEFACTLGRATNFALPVRTPGSRNSDFLGVSWETNTGKWKAQIIVDGKITLLGRFDAGYEEVAAHRYDEAAAAIGRPLNFPRRGSGASESRPTDELDNEAKAPALASVVSSMPRLTDSAATDSSVSTSISGDALDYQQNISAFIGRRVKKEFPGHGMYSGTVVGYSSPFFRVRYEDSDEEEYEEDDLKKILVKQRANANSLASPSSLPVATAAAVKAGDKDGDMRGKEDPRPSMRRRATKTPARYLEPVSAAVHLRRDSGPSLRPPLGGQSPLPPFDETARAGGASAVSAIPDPPSASSVEAAWESLPVEVKK